jgi:hypothetical protein
LAVCRELGIAKLFTTAYHPQTNGQVERFNRTIVNALRNYVGERPQEWDEFTAALTFSYNCRLHSSLGLAPFELVLSRPPPSLSVESPEKDAEETPATMKLRFLQRLKELCPVAQQRLKEAQERYKRNFDNSIREKNKNIAPGQWVYLRKEVHDNSVNPKLDTKADGPFQALENSGHTLLLQQGEMRNRISSDRVTPAPTPHTLDGADPGRPAEAVNNRLPVEETTRSQETPNPAERDSESEPAPQEEEYVVERVVGAKQMRDGTLYYKVRWYGYPPESDTWEPAYHLPEILLRRYHKRIRLPWPRSPIQGN